VTPKPDGLRALDVKNPYGLNYSSQKGYEAKLAIQSTKLKFSPFDANAQSLMRQEARLLNEKLKVIFFFSFFFLFFICKYILQAKVIYQ
jgi:hypothetical protein